MHSLFLKNYFIFKIISIYPNSFIHFKSVFNNFKVNKSISIQGFFKNFGFKE